MKNKVKSKLTGEEITLKEYFERLAKSFIEENDEEEITLEDIKSWCDGDDAFEAAELVDGEPTVEYMMEYEELYNKYLNDCKNYFKIN